jgi:Fe2+ or Zn2+ uptake regulation protein
MCAAHSTIHDDIAERLASVGQRYTSGRRRLIDAISERSGPSSIFDIMRAVPDMPQSSAYRHLTVLSASGIVRRLSGTDDLGYFELSDELSGHHHHHVLCERCGTVVDVGATSRLEQALTDAARVAAEETGFQVEGHRIDLFGLCPDCQRA